MTLLDIAEQPEPVFDHTLGRLDEAIYALFLERGLEREIHFSELAKVGGIGGWRTRVSTARQMFKRRGFDIKNRQVRHEGRTDSYYRLVIKPD